MTADCLHGVVSCKVGLRGKAFFAWGMFLSVFVGSIFSVGMILKLTEWLSGAILNPQAATALLVVVGAMWACYIALVLPRDVRRCKWTFDGKELSSPSLKAPLRVADVVFVTVGIPRLKSWLGWPLRKLHPEVDFLRDSTIVLFVRNASGEETLCLKLQLLLVPIEGGATVMSAVWEAVASKARPSVDWQLPQNKNILPRKWNSLVMARATPQ